MSFVPRPMTGNTPWRDRADSQHNGGVNRKHRSTNQPKPSELFDWDRAIAGFKGIMEERYGKA